MTAVGQMTCKTWYKALIAHRYCYTLKVAAKVPTVFQEGAGWHKLLGIVAPIRSPFLEWQKILRLQNRIGSTRAMEAVPYFCSRVFYHSLFCPLPIMKRSVTARLVLTTSVLAAKMWNFLHRMLYLDAQV